MASCLKLWWHSSVYGTEFSLLSLAWSCSHKCPPRLTSCSHTGVKKGSWLPQTISHLQCWLQCLSSTCIHFPLSISPRGVSNSFLKMNSKFSSLVTSSSSPVGRAGLVLPSQALPLAVIFVIFVKILRVCHQNCVCPSLSAPQTAYASRA